MANRDLSQLVEEVNPYAFLNEVSEELGPPENPDIPEEWLSQVYNITTAHEEFESPALSKLGDIAEFEDELHAEADDFQEVMENEGYIAALGASIAQTEYWALSLWLEKLDGYLEAASKEGRNIAEYQELRGVLEDEAFTMSFLMWKNGLSHLMYMNYDSFFRERGFNYLDYHEKIHVSFVILTGSTLLETSLKRVLVDLGENDAPKKNLHNLIDMAWSRTGLDETDRETLHDLRDARNLIAHDISQRTNYQGSEEVENLGNHFEATFGVTIRALNVASRLLDETHGLEEPLSEFHTRTEKLVDFISEKSSN